VKVVLDTNVLISGIFFGGLPRTILDAWAEERFELLVSPIPITADPGDDKFMLCARESGAIIVSGDRHLLDASGWEGVRVMKPHDFLLYLENPEAP